jgi:small subunit ribosomal protein S2
MSQPEIKDLLQAGVHFGHQTRRWNPKMRRFIFAERSGIYLIDLQKTLSQLKAAQDLMREIVLKGDNVLFVCTKRQLNMIVKSEAERCGAHWVTERWLGGTLTNFHTIKHQIRRLKELEQGQEEGAFEFFTKKEQLRFERERQKLNRNLEGIKNMGRLPGAMFVVDARKERIAIAEANKLGIPVVAIVDTNADPDLITVPIPGNDDAIRSVSLITGALVDVVAEARSQVPAREVAIDTDTFTTYSTDTGEADAAEAAARRRPRRKRRPKPEAIAARLKAERGPDEAKTAESEPQGEDSTPAAEARPASPKETDADETADGAKPAAKQKAAGKTAARAKRSKDTAEAEAATSQAVEKGPPTGFPGISWRRFSHLRQSTDNQDNRNGNTGISEGSECAACQDRRGYDGLQEGAAGNRRRCAEGHRLPQAEGYHQGGETRRADSHAGCDRGLCAFQQQGRSTSRTQL